MPRKACKLQEVQHLNCMKRKQQATFGEQTLKVLLHTAIAAVDLIFPDGMKPTQSQVHPGHPDPI